MADPASPVGQRSGFRSRPSGRVLRARPNGESERSERTSEAEVLAADPLLHEGLKWTPLLIIGLKVLVIFAVALVATIFMVWFERKIIAGMQNRIGPNKAGPFGVLQTLADGMKLIFKEDFLPDRADRFVYRLAPFLAFVPAFLVWSVIPLGGDFSDDNNGTVTWFGHETTVQLADPPVGILFVLALSSIAVYGIMLAGWSSGSKYPLLGSVRASAQMVSYEAALGLSVASVVLVTGTLTMSGIVNAQDTFARWNLIATGFVPFIAFVIAATAELNRPPFDLVEAEQELVSGFNTEYASFRFALFFLAEFMNTVTMSAIIVTLFLGGPRGLFDIPLINDGLEGTIWFVAKVFIFLYVYVWFRATLPRFRYDQLMDLGWKVLIPVSLGVFLFLAAMRVAQDNDWNRGVVGVAAAASLAAGLGLMVWALTVSRRNREREGAY
jgi:NADH-quinone oxidoreductase subunit H